MLRKEVTSSRCTRSCATSNLLKACTQRGRPARLHDRDLLREVDAILAQEQPEDRSCECIDRVARLALRRSPLGTSSSASRQLTQVAWSGRSAEERRLSGHRWLLHR